MTTEEIKEKLTSKKSTNRRRASKEIGKSKLSEFGDDLYDAYLKEKNDKRTWETNSKCGVTNSL